MAQRIHLTAITRAGDGDGAFPFTAFEDLDHVRLTRDFLNAPERYLRKILTP